MRIIHSSKKVQGAVLDARRKGKKIGFVPTMGALHEGHLSLMQKCRRENDLVVISIFVNPKQFGPKEDLSTYPRDKKKDVLLAKKENVDIIFYPSEKEMYPDRYLTYVEVEQITHSLCGKFRAGHFKGVTTIVAKLLHLVPCDTLYLGQKDAQQAVVITQMVRDLNFPCRVRILPTVRERDGLAMSSRNAYLSPRQRSEAPILYRALRGARHRILSGEKSPKVIKQNIRRAITQGSSGKVQYIACVHADTLEPLPQLKGRVLIALAVYFGKTRLIDNIIINIQCR